MNSHDIAETLVNGNIGAAREAILTSESPAIMALDVADVLAVRHPDPPEHEGTWDSYYHAIGRVRRCLRSGVES